MKQTPFFRLFRQSGIYALGNVAIKTSGLILAPFYLDTNHLSLSEYGQLGVLLVFAQISTTLGGLGFNNGLLKYVGRESEHNTGFSASFTALVSAVICAAIVLVGYYSFSGFLAEVLLDGEKQMVQLTAIYISSKIVSSVPMMVMRIHERASLYALTVAVEMSVLIGAAYYFLVIKQLGLKGILLGYVISGTLSMAVVVVFCVSRIKWQFNVHVIRALLQFGGPLIFVGLAGIILNAGDRFILKAFVGHEGVGRYEWAARMSGVLNLFVVQSFQLAFTVIGLKTLNKGDKRFSQDTFRHFVVLLGWATLGVAILSYELTTVLSKMGASEQYINSTYYVFPLCLGVMTYGVYVVINNVLYAAAKTHLITINVILAALLNILLNVLLIPWIGIMGAALSTVLSYGALLGMSNWVAKRELAIRYPWNTFFYVILLLTTLYLCSYLVIQLPWWPRLFIRLFIVLAYIPLLAIFNIYSYREIKRGVGYLASQLTFE